MEYTKRDFYHPTAIIEMPNGEEAKLDLTLGYTAFGERAEELLSQIFPGEERDSQDEEDLPVLRYEGFGPAIELNHYTNESVFQLRELHEEAVKADESMGAADAFMVFVNSCLNGPQGPNGWRFGEPGLYERAHTELNNFYGCGEWEEIVRCYIENHLERDLDGNITEALLASVDVDKFVEEYGLEDKFYNPHQADGFNKHQYWWFTA